MRSRAMTRFLSLAVALAVFCASRPALAQTNSMFGSRGPSSMIGTNLRGSNVGIGTTQSGPTFMGISGNSLTGAQFGSATGPTGGNIVGRDDTAGRFVGDQRFGQLGQGGNSNRGSINFGNRGRGGRGNRNINFPNGANGAAGGQRKRAALRPQQRVAFSYPAPTTQAVNVTVDEHLRQISKLQPELAGVNVAVDANGMATLSGAVDSAEQSRLAELLVRLEPGVRSTHNELVVTPDAAGN